VFRLGSGGIGLCSAGVVAVYSVSFIFFVKYSASLARRFIALVDSVAPVIPSIFWVKPRFSSSVVWVNCRVNLGWRISLP